MKPWADNVKCKDIFWPLWCVSKGDARTTTLLFYLWFMTVGNFRWSIFLCHTFPLWFTVPSQAHSKRERQREHRLKFLELWAQISSLPSQTECFVITIGSSLTVFWLPSHSHFSSVFHCLNNTSDHSCLLSFYSSKFFFKTKLKSPESSQTCTSSSFMCSNLLDNIHIQWPPFPDIVLKHCELFLWLMNLWCGEAGQECCLFLPWSIL